MTVICSLKSSLMSISMENTLIQGHHVNPRQPLMCPVSLHIAIGGIFQKHGSSHVTPPLENSLAPCFLWENVHGSQGRVSRLSSVIRPPLQSCSMCFCTTPPISAPATLDHIQSRDYAMLFPSFVPMFTCSPWLEYFLSPYVCLGTPQPGYPLFKILSFPPPLEFQSFLELLLY